MLNGIAYRPLFDVNVTAANIYNFLGQFEEGQGIMLEDEMDNIEEQDDKMRIYKTGYVSGAQVTRMYDSSDGNKGKGQRYNTFCFKAFSSERQQDYKAKGFSERIFLIKCTPGSPQYDISEITNDAGDPEHKKLYREIEDLRKLLLVYRILHYDDQIPDLELSTKNRDKQLCKPLLRLFNNTKAQDEIITSLSKFLAEKKNKKLDSFDAYLYSVVSDLVKEENTVVSNEVLWNTVCSLPGTEIPNRPLSYNTEDFGIVSRARVTRTCEDKFGAVKGHDGQKRSLVFNKTNIQKLKANYSPVEKIKIIDNSTTNTFNTFNTFWKGVEINAHYSNKIKDTIITKSEQEVKEYEENSEYNNENSESKSTLLIEDKTVSSDKVLEPLEVLVDEKQLKDGKENETTMEQKIDNVADKVLKSSTNAASKLSVLPNYKYTKEDIDKFFASNNGQKDDHRLEESICRPLIGQHNYKPFFTYCKLCSKVENINLISIESHIRLADPEKHEAKLLEYLEKGEEKKKDKGN